MYHLGSHHTAHPQQHHGSGPGLSVTGASKSKLAGPSSKPTIAISGTTKRKTTSQSNLTEQQTTKSKGASRVQNQKVHLQQAQHPPQQPMYQQEIPSSSEQMIMNYVNRMQQ